MAHRTDASVDIGTGGWGTPTNLGCTLNSSVFEDGPTYFVDPDTQRATLYFTSLNRLGGQGDWDIMKSDQQADGTWSAPVFVTELDANDRDTRTAMRYDGLELLLTSRRAGSLTDATGANTLDLWVSARSNRSAPWSTPISLGPTINSSVNDGAPALSKDASELIFYSNRTGGFGANDLYVSHRTRTAVYGTTQ